MSRMLPGLLLCVLTTGCATMVNGRHQVLSVDSYPSGAAIEVDCGDGASVAGSTPARVRVRRAAESCQLTLNRAGYEPKVIQLTRQESRATALNAVFGVPSAVVLGIVGALVGSTVNGAETGAEIGVEAGFDLGSLGATELDKKGGGWKWVPGRIFAILYRIETTPGDPADPE
ncbi:MAG: hypothetical protein JJE51_03550 [Thermoanaerobaculia bacterium]|nr:hypothetical protein [Thermoanaerobaculia bacterium]